MFLPVWLEVLFLGIIEGVTEFIPVSSTGHLLIAQHWLRPRSDLFNIVIQGGAVLAVLPLFPERLRQFVFHWREPATRDYLLKILTAFAITGAGGVLLDQANFQLPEEVLPVALALVVGGILFIAVERWLRGRQLGSEVGWAVVVAVGLGQLLAALFPGLSRSGATILLALVLGLDRLAATEFSFLVGIPTLLSAGALKVAGELRHPAEGAAEDWGMVLLGAAVAAAVSFVAVKWLLRYVRTHTFTGFGWYRVLIGGLLLLFFWR